MAALLHETLATQLTDDLKSDAGLSRSTAAALAVRYGVARLTMLRALRLLRERGLLDFTRGRRIRAPRTVTSHQSQRSEPRGQKADAAESIPLSPAMRVSEAIELEISCGAWRQGLPLPKMHHLTKIFHASKSTVSSALHYLAGKQLVHKRGKSWHAGRAQNEILVRGSIFPPTILLLADHEDRWTTMFTDRQLNRFAEAFSGEAEERGVQLLPVLTRPRGPETVLASGRNAIADTVRELGSRYLGGLMLPNRMQKDEVREWLEFMSSLGRPALRLMPPGAGYVFIDNPRIVSCMFGSWGSIRHGGAAAVAWDMLASLGHRVIGMPAVIPEFEGLVDIMNDLFLRDAKTSADQLTTIKGAAAFWNLTDQETPDRIISRLRTTGVPFVRKIIQSKVSPGEKSELLGRFTEMEQRLIGDTALIAPLIAHHGITALIGANDFLARRIYLWCRAAGIRIPADLSLISFDNSVEIKPYPISSMDLGQRRLGFKSFHLLFGDIPVKPTSANQLWGGTSLNHAASLGPPSKRDLSPVVRGEWQ